jgi:hypothetical protein
MSKKYFLVYFCFFLILIFRDVNAKETPAISTGAKTLNAIFVVDISSSMLSGARYQSAISALKTMALSKTFEKSNLALLTWGSNSCVWTGIAADCPSLFQWIGFSSDPSISRNAIVAATTGDLSKWYSGGSSYLDYAMDFLDSYLSSTEFSKYDNSCATTIVIVLSDGDWVANRANQIAVKLNTKQSSIKTFVVAIGVDPSIDKNFALLANAGGSTSPYGGINVDTQSLVSIFSSVIQSQMFDSYTGTAPLIVPKGGELTDDLIITPEFETSAKGQWKGYLKADVINSDGSFGVRKWEFGQNLAAMDPEKRQIWTAACAYGGCIVPPVRGGKTLPNNLSKVVPVGTLVNLFETSGALSQQTAMVDALNLVNFIRGYDVFDEDNNKSTSTRWPLSDIYNSKPIFVGPPKLSFNNSPDFIGGDQYFYNQNPGAYISFQLKWAKRKTVVYAGSNGGVVHAINATNGQELWAFVPPPLLQKFKGVISSQPNSSNSIFGVDGALVAKDVFISGEWRTYLAIMLGKGARGLSVIDITDPDYPLHVVSIHNDFPVPGPTTTSWNEDLYHFPGPTNQTTVRGRCATRYLANGSTNPTCDGPGNGCSGCGYFQGLGYTVSEPVFTYGRDGTYQPALQFGAGEGDENTYTGAVVYSMNLSDSNAGWLLGASFTSDASNPLPSTLNKTVISNSTGTILTIDSTTGINLGSYVIGSNISSGTKVAEILGASSLRLDLAISNGKFIPQGTTISFQTTVHNEVKARPEIVESGQISIMKGKYGRVAVVANNNGYIHSFNESSSSPTSVPFNANGKQLITSGTNNLNDRLISFPVTLSSYTFNISNNLNIIYGTGENLLNSFGKNPDNMVVSFQDIDSNVFVANAGSGWTKVCGVERPECYRPNYVSPAAVQINSTNFLNASTETSGKCPNSSQKGWVVYFNQVKANDLATGESKLCSNGKLKQQIAITNGVAMITGYSPATSISPKATSCSIGNSFILFRDPSCGYDLNGGVFLSNTIISGITPFKEKLYLSINNSKENKGLSPNPNKLIVSGNTAVLMNIPKKDYFINPGIIKSKVRIN